MTDRPERPNGALRAKARCAEKAYLCLGGAKIRFCRSGARMDTRAVAIREQRRSETQGVFFQVHPPVLAFLGQGPGVAFHQHRLRKSVKQRALVLEMPVKRRLLNLEAFSELSRRQVVHANLVQQLQCRRDHGALVQFCHSRSFASA